MLAHVIAIERKRVDAASVRIQWPHIQVKNFDERAPDHQGEPRLSPAWLEMHAENAVGAPIEVQVVPPPVFREPDAPHHIIPPTKCCPIFDMKAVPITPSPSVVHQSLSILNRGA